MLHRRATIIVPAPTPTIPATWLWTPASLGSALKAWWNADDTSDGAVATWTDRTGSMAVTAAAGLQPISAATSFNGRRGLTFDGVDDCLVSTSLGTIPTGATAGEMWATATNSNSGLQTICAYGATPSNALRSLLLQSQRIKISDNVTILTHTPTYNQALPHIFGGYWSGTTEGGRVDGADFSPSSTATMSTLATATTRLRIGAYAAPSASLFLAGVVRHVFITLALTAAQRFQLEGWAAWDAGVSYLLPTSHPFRYGSP